MQRVLRRAYRISINKAKAHYRRGLWSAAFSQLERAHILGQRDLGAHLVTHWWMLKCGWQQRSAKEVIGQLLRLLAVLPGFISGWVPLGNTGGANVSALKPMPLPDDIKALLPAHPIRRDLSIRLLLCTGAMLLWLFCRNSG